MPLGTSSCRLCLFVIGSMAIAVGPWVPGSAGRAQTTPSVTPRGTQQPSMAPSSGPPKPSAGVVTGRVLDAATGNPVPGATVGVSRAAGNVPVLQDPVAASSQRLPEEAVTSNGGYYVIRNLPPGNFSIYARAGGYVDGGYGRRQPEGPIRAISLETDERILGADILMWRAASISGTVTDESGDPTVAAEVRVLRRTFVGGLPRFAPMRSVQTDDRGMFRLGGLLPGDYVVSVPAVTATYPVAVGDAYRAVMQGGGAPNDPQRAQFTEMMLQSGGLVNPSAAGIRMGDHIFSPRSQSTAIPPEPRGDGPLYMYRAAYYPDPTLSTNGGMITLSSGEDRSGIDIQLELVPSWRVSGTVVGPDGPLANVPVRLLRSGLSQVVSDAGQETAATIANGAGQFTLFGVPPGIYSLQVRRVPRNVMSAATATTIISVGGGGAITYSSVGAQGGAPPEAPTDPAFWADHEIQVADRDVTGVTVLLRTGTSVSGELRFEGTAVRPTPDQLQRVTVGLRPQSGAAPPGAPVPGRPDADGRFTSHYHFPGFYTLSVPAPSPWTVKSVTVGGRDITGWPLEVGTTDIEGLVITFTDRPSTLRGTVRGAGAGALPPSTVVIFPADVEYWLNSGMPDARRRSIAVAETGNFTAMGLFPGDYLAVALDANEPVDLQNPSLYSSLARTATPVTVREGSQTTVSVPLTSLR